MAKNDAVLSKGKPSTAGLTAENTNLHKLLKMGQNPKFEIAGGKKTSA